MRVLLADDHTLVRAGIRRIVEGFTDMEVVAEARDGREAIDLVALHRPDVAIVDLSMPVQDGFAVTRTIRAQYPGTAVVIMSMHTDTGYVRQAMSAGALGFVVKEAAPAELELALHAAANGQTFLSPKVSGRMMNAMLRRDPGDRLGELSPRQREILVRLARGQSTKEIAADLAISVKTVETHRARMMETLGMRRGTDLVRFAIENRLEIER
ncbi:MAG: response regulator transcription factor [Xanthomonadaceae bacterium]|nr:response regulator transcription factor [Xanthomonadaceae bacterium]